MAATVVVVASLALVGALVISSAQAVKAVAGTNEGSRYGHSTEYVPPAPGQTQTPGYLPGYSATTEEISEPEDVGNGRIPGADAP